MYYPSLNSQGRKMYNKEEVTKIIDVEVKKSRRCFKKLMNKLMPKSDKVAVLRLSGVIGAAGTFKKGLSLEDIEEEIEKAFDVKNLKAVAVQVNSPGGSPVQSELIYNRIRALSAEKKVPVFTFIEDVGASGGYWLACSGDEIYASASSVVGSIGVISAGFGFVEAIKKLGVERRVYHQGENKSILDPFRPENPKDVEILMDLQKDVHEEFKNLVRSRRGSKIKKEDENKLFSGEFWTGVRAKELGLVDEIGDLRAVMREKYGKKIEFEKVSKPKGWLKRKLGVVGGAFADGIVSSISDRALWGRFGL
jgi:signal peptide peptidase SppA